MAITLDGTTGITASGNITGNYILGNGSQLSGIITSVSSLSNGTSNVVATTSGGNVTVGVGGTPNVAVFTATGANIAGTFNVTGNTALANVLIAASKTIDVGNNKITNVAEPVANSDAVTKSYVDSITSSGFTVQDDTANTTVVSAGDTLQLYGTANEVIVAITTTDRVTFGLPDNVTVTGNITANYFLGNGSQLTGIDATAIQNGTSNVRVAANGNVTVSSAGIANVLVVTSTGANIAGTLNATGNANVGNIGATAVVATNLTGTLQTAAQTNITSVGTLTSLAVTGNITSGNVNGTAGTFTNVTGTLQTAAQPNVTSVGTLGSLSVTGNVTGGNLNSNAAVTGVTGVFSGNISASYYTGNGSLLTGIDATAIQNGTANVRAFLNGNVTVSATGTANVLVVTSTGANIAGTLNTGTGNANVGNIGATAVVATNLTGTLQTAAQTNITSVGTLTGLTINNATIAITNGGSNGVGNIGSSTGYFNTVFAKATSAQYADLAEMYEADQIIEPGTVVCFGGTKEITVCGSNASSRVAGVVSTNPSYIMNSGLQGEYVVAVTLQGRVPVRVTGVIAKGDMMVATADGRAQAEKKPKIGTVIGKALADFDGTDGVIEVVVGRV